MNRRGRITYIDFARGYAIFTIVCYHGLQRADLPGLWQKATAFGGTGVHLFFLLSGFGLGLSGAGYRIADFYRRRLTKVWLPYVLALTISVLAAFFWGVFPDGFDAWLAGAGLYQMFSERYIESFGGHFWFISAILQFYLVYPFLYRLKKRLPDNRKFLALSLLLSVFWWLLVWWLGKGHLRVWNSFFLQFLWEFALGMVLAGRYEGKDTRAWLRGDFWRYPAWVYLPAGLLFSGLMLLFTLQFGATGKIFNDIPALLGYTALCIALYRLGENMLPQLNRFFLWVGSFSYSLYLVHVFVLESYIRALHAAGIAVNSLSLLPFAALALLAGRLFEPVSRRWTALFEQRDY